jgi:hypothetical protein
MGSKQAPKGEGVIVFSEGVNSLLNHQTGLSLKKDLGLFENLKPKDRIKIPMDKNNVSLAGIDQGLKLLDHFQAPAGRGKLRKRHCQINVGHGSRISIGLGTEQDQNPNTGSPGPILEGSVSKSGLIHEPKLFRDSLVYNQLKKSRPSVKMAGSVGLPHGALGLRNPYPFFFLFPSSP